MGYYCLLYFVFYLPSNFITITGNTLAVKPQLVTYLGFPSFSPALVTALCLFALAEVFKHGLVLRQEQDLTV